MFKFIYELFFRDRDTLVSLIDKLSDGDSKFSSDSAANEDSNSLSEKPVTDTGQTDTDSKPNLEEDKDKEDEESTEPKEESNKLEDKEDLSEDESKNEEVSVNGDEEEQNSKPVLRIKTISELTGGGLKRSKSECDNEESQEKVLKIKIKKLNEESVVGDAIEEPVMKVQGEGSGEENEGACFHNKQDSENILQDESSDRTDEKNPVNENPIVEEAIEEDVMYFYGEGNGFECLTGNEEKGASNETHSNSKVSADDKCLQNSSLTGSIKDNLSDFKDNNIKAKEVPLIKLGTIIDTKTDNIVNKLPAGSSKKSRWDVETLQDTQSNTKLESSQVITGKVKDLVNKFEQVGSPPRENIADSATPPATPKMSTFFFGSGSFKSNSVSPSLTIGFGQNSPDKYASGTSNEFSEKSPEKVEDEIKESSQNEVSCDPLKKEEKENIEHSISKNDNEVEENNIQISHNDETVKDTDDCNKNNTIDLNEDEVKSDTDISKSKEAVDDSCKNDVEPTDKIIEESSEIVDVPEKQEQNHEIENGETKDNITKTIEKENKHEEDDTDQHVPVTEPECIKKTAYVCGDTVSDKEDALSDSEKSISADEKDAVNVDHAKEEEDESVEKEKQIDDLVENTNKKIEEENRLGDKETDNTETVQPVKSDEGTVTEENVSEVLEGQEHKMNECNKEKPSDQDNQTENKSLCDSTDMTSEQVKNDLNKQQKPQVSLRSIRSKKVANSNSVEKDQPVFVSTGESNPVETETIYLNARRGRSKKQVLENPSDSVLNEATEKSKETDEINDGEKESVSVKSGKRLNKAKVTSTDKEDEIDKKGKEKDNSNIPSADSSRVNSPVSVSDSIILLPDSSENTVDYPLKDPLANSDEEEVSPPQKPLNLQSLSLDYNESSTPPPIPIIPSRRTLRKRGREASPEAVKETAVSVGKKMKLKGKRQVDTKLRKSIEQKKQQQISSSDEVVEVSDSEKPAGKSRKKGKQAKNKKKGPVIEISDEDSGTPVPKPKRKYNKNSKLFLCCFNVTLLRF